MSKIKDYVTSARETKEDVQKECSHLQYSG